MPELGEVERASHNRGKESSAVSNDDFGSVSFEGGELSLASFQRWVSRGIPSECVRAKGFVTFAEEPDVPYDFHMSGRRRVEIEPSADRGGPAALATGFKAKSTANAKAATRLVLIGPEIDQNAAHVALEALETPPDCEAGDVAGALERADDLAAELAAGRSALDVASLTQSAGEPRTAAAGTSCREVCRPSTRPSSANRACSAAVIVIAWPHADCSAAGATTRTS